MKDENDDEGELVGPNVELRCFKCGKPQHFCPLPCGRETACDGKDAYPECTDCRHSGLSVRAVPVPMPSYDDPKPTCFGCKSSTFVIATGSDDSWQWTCTTCQTEWKP